MPDNRYCQRVCAMCGKDMGVVWYRTRYCPDCGRTARNQRQKVYKQRFKERRSPQPKKQQKALTAAECAYIDRALGMSYGEAQVRGYHTRERLEALQCDGKS